MSNFIGSGFNFSRERLKSAKMCWDGAELSLQIFPNLIVELNGIRVESGKVDLVMASLLFFFWKVRQIWLDRQRFFRAVEGFWRVLNTQVICGGVTSGKRRHSQLQLRSQLGRQSEQLHQSNSPPQLTVGQVSNCYINSSFRHHHYVIGAWKGSFYLTVITELCCC